MLMISFAKGVRVGNYAILQVVCMPKKRNATVVPYK